MRIIIFMIAVIVIIALYYGRNKESSQKKGAGTSNKIEEHKISRKPLSENAIRQYTMKMDEAYDRMRKAGGNVLPGFPWSAVFLPSRMKSILRAEDLVDVTYYDQYLANLGRFKLSIEAYGRYGVKPTCEVIDYIDNNLLNPEIDEALSWYRKMHG